MFHLHHVCLFVREIYPGHGFSGASAASLLDFEVIQIDPGVVS